MDVSKPAPQFASTVASVYASGLGDFGAVAQGLLVVAGSPLLVDPAWFGCARPLRAAPSLNCRIRISSVACGTTHSLFVGSTGALYSCGGNTSGQLGLGAKRGMALQPTEVPFFLGHRVHHVAAGRAHSLAVASCPAGTQRVFAWGSNSAGQCGIGKGAPDTVLVPAPVDLSVGSGATTASSASELAGVAAGGNTSMAWGQHGELWGWGAHANGQAGVGALEHRDAVPQPVLSSDLMQRQERVVSASVGTQHSLILTSGGALYVCGSRLYGRCGMGEEGQGGDIYTPLRLLRGVDAQGESTNLGSVRFTSVSAGTTHSLAVDSEGLLWAWGDGEKLPGDEGTLAATGAVRLSSTHVDVPTVLPLPWPGAEAESAAGKAAEGDGDGDGDGASDNDSTCSQADVAVHAWPLRSAAAGADHSLVLGADGRVAGWGYSAWMGTLPDADVSHLTHSSGRAVSIPLPSGVPVAQVAAGAHHSLFVVAEQLEHDADQGSHFCELCVLQPPVPGSVRELMTSDLRSNAAVLVPLAQCSLPGESPVDARSRLHSQAAQYLAEHGTLRGAWKEELDACSACSAAPASDVAAATGVAAEAAGSARAASAARRAAVDRARSTSRGRGPLRAAASSVEEGGVGGRRLEAPQSPADSHSNPMAASTHIAGSAAAPRLGSSLESSGGEEWAERGAEESSAGRLCRWLTCGMCASAQQQD